MNNNTRGDMFRWTSLALMHLVLLSGMLRAEITLSGEQDGFYEQSEYLVTENVVIKSGKTLTFAPGSIIRFNQYAGIIVHGSLFCEGTPMRPVIFTSTKTHNTDLYAKQNPQPFDWNGIHVKSPDAKVVLKYVDISYSTYGLKFDHKSAAAKLDQLTYGDNGTTSVELGDSLIDLFDGEPLSLTHPSVDTAETRQTDSAFVATLAPQDTTPGPPSPSIYEEEDPKAPRKKWIVPARITFGALAALAAGAGAYSYVRWEQNYEKYSDQKDKGSLESYEEKGLLYEKALNAGLIGCGVSVVGFCLTFVF